MNRSSIIERLYELNQSDFEIDKDRINQLMYDVLNNKVSIEDAEVELRSIDPSYTRYEFLQNLKGKPIYQSIKDYKKDKLNNIQIAKMVSSLITQILIQHEKNPSVSCKALQIDALIEILSDYSSYGLEVIDRKLLDHLLDVYGWDDQDGDNRDDTK